MTTTILVCSTHIEVIKKKKKMKDTKSVSKRERQCGRVEKEISDLDDYCASARSRRSKSVEAQLRRSRLYSRCD